MNKVFISTIVATTLLTTSGLAISPTQESIVTIIEKINNNEKDIQLLKKATVKIIGQLDEIKSNQEKMMLQQAYINPIKEKIMELEANKTLETKVVTPSKTEASNTIEPIKQGKYMMEEPVLQKPSSTATINTTNEEPRESIISDIISAKPKLKTEKKENIVKHYEAQPKKDYSDTDIIGSFKVFDKLRTFGVSKNHKEIVIYDKPILESWGSNPIGKIKNNEILEADKYTKYGWIHVKNRGWVKGYLLTPAFESER